MIRRNKVGTVKSLLLQCLLQLYQINSITLHGNPRDLKAVQFQIFDRRMMRWILTDDRTILLAKCRQYNIESLCKAIGDQYILALHLDALVLHILLQIVY
ncbi:hypothetical protein D3C76_1455040 [compost metagenome]